MRLFRTALLIGLAAWFLPSPPPGEGPAQETAGANGATLALAAMQAASDAATFCDRQPDVCDTARKAWNVLRAKLVYSAGLAFDEWRRRSSDTPEAPHPAASHPATDEGFEQPDAHPPGLRGTSVPPVPESGDIGRLLRGTSADPLVTGSVTTAWNRNSGDGGGDGSENTLEIRDLTVPWNGPKEG